MLKTKDLDNQVEYILDFLKLIHPGLEDDRLAIELRPIQRGPYNYSNSKSLNLWRYDKDSIKYLKRFLEKHKNETNCLYYSVFRFDTDVKAITTSGKMAQPGKITSMAARIAETIVFDFDNIDEDRRRELVLKFEAYGLRLSWVFSGNGYHGLLHLSDVLRDPRLIKLLVTFFNNEGFGIDENCVDSARVMRLPYTHNYKDLDNPIPTELIEVSEDRYSTTFLFSLMDLMPKEELTKEKGDLTVLGEYDFPKAIQQMLTYVPQGFRNSTLGFLVGFLKTSLGFGHEQLYTVMKEWAKETCSPAYPTVEFQVDFDRFYFGGALPYSKTLAEHFGFINFSEFATLQKQHYIYINTQVFDLVETPGELRAFLMVKLLEHGGEKGVSIHDLIEWSEMNLKYSKNGLTINTVRRDLKNGLRNKLLYRKYGNKKAGEPDLYFSNQLFNLTSGHYLLPANDADVFLSSLNLNQLKLYLYLSYLQSFGVNFISQQKLADDLGISRPRISTLIKELEKVRFIRVDRQRYGKAVRFCTYTLLR